MKINIYTTPTCAYCHMAKNFFDANKIEYTEFDVSSDLAKADDMVKKSGQMGVPVIEMGDEIIVGFDKARISKILGI